MKNIFYLLTASLLTLSFASCGLTERKMYKLINEEVNHPQYFVLNTGTVSLEKENPAEMHNAGYNYLLIATAGVDDVKAKKHRTLKLGLICKGCPYCYAKYQEAGLITYEVTPNAKRAKVTLTAEGEKYAIHDKKKGRTYVYMGTPKVDKLIFHHEEEYEERKIYTFPAYFEELSPFLTALGNKEKVNIEPCGEHGNNSALFRKVKNEKGEKEWTGGIGMRISPFGE